MKRQCAQDLRKKLICPKCGELTMDDVHLTELGQGQLTEATMDL
jgi:hypothetical protein